MLYQLILADKRQGVMAMSAKPNRACQTSKKFMLFEP